MRNRTGQINLYNRDEAFDAGLKRTLQKLDTREDIYADITLTGTCHLNGTIVSVPCAGAVMGAPYWFSTGSMSSADGSTCSMNPANAVRVSSTACVELTWNAAMNTAGDVIGGTGAMIFIEGRRVRRV
jgi:hypothetical protein